MKNVIWKGKAFKALSFGRKCKKAGRNFSGSITSFHRGGGSKKLIRRINFQRQLTLSKGIIERIEYDPNRTARIALVRWFERQEEVLNLRNSFSSLESNKMVTYKNPTHFWYSSDDKVKTPALVRSVLAHPLLPESAGNPFFYSFDKSFSKNDFIKSEKVFKKDEQEQKEQKLESTQSNLSKMGSFSAFSYILACEKLNSGDEIFNLENKLDTENRIKNILSTENKAGYGVEHLFQKSGNSLPLSLAPLGSIIHNIESFPGSGGKLVRSAGTFAQLIQKMSLESQKNFDGNKTQRSVANSGTCCLIRLPSGQLRSIDIRCRATLGTVSNVEHDSQKLFKAGQNRWRGFRPTVRGVAMNPIDHPHGGGEGRTKGGRPSVSPWGKPAKGSRRKMK